MKVKKILCIILVFVMFLVTPQVTYSYDFSSLEKEVQVRQTRTEIFELYNMHKELVKSDDDAETNKFGVTGYNGVCSNVTVDGKTISLDEYIAGVIKQEMGGNNLEALKAQAIAARSFLLSTHEKSSDCSVDNGQNYQAYTTASEGEIYMKAAKETSGMVIKRNNKIALTQYISHPAGQYSTEDSTGWHVKMQRFNDDPKTAWTWNGPAKETVQRTAGDGYLYGVEPVDTSHHFGMSQTIAMYLAKKENYTYEQLIKLFYDQPIVTLSDGVYDANLTYVKSSSFNGQIVYYNQGDYKGYYLSTDPKNKWNSGTIPSAGCGPTAIAMIIASIQRSNVDPIQTTSKVCKYGRCSSGGTWIDDLYKTLTNDYHMNAKWEGKKQNVINALSSGNSLVLALMGPGTFTSGGHYIVLTGIDSEGKVSVADPASRDRTKKKYSFNLILEQKQASNFIVVTQ